MSEHIVRRPVASGYACSAAIAATVVAFLLTVIMPPTGFLAGLIALVVLGVSIARRHATVATAIAAGVSAAVLGYLGIWLVGSIVDPSAPSSGSGSSSPQTP